ncbi:MAG: YggS family pyridoxal phosphate-dependent enzyme [Armatimonadetes bacterium]|nr:YggS family pyridoxal phosphate-dependent enzyme [Armatimonadota bacterium]MCX7966908.1 YggS family pyridoxal phosphate-dependent enzyme [Armatimonadota bacterium]MDW8141865.1 YggS family pyridoxal phosphate-dependent enzyme [Armatimonadota bacterium]
MVHATSIVERVKENLEKVRERIALAAERVGRDPSEIVLVGATKSVDVERISAAIEAGLEHIGENYAQEAWAKYQQIGDAVTWHFIGHLQTNKAKLVVRFCRFVQSLDRLALAEELNKRAEQIGRIVDCLVEVNIGGEETKSGVPPSEVENLIRQVSQFPNIRVVGLMAMPPFLPNPEQVRPYFKQMRELFERLKNIDLPRVEMRYLSMGMSHDFEVAIEEGANMVRIGTAIFGPRPIKGGEGR